MGNRKAGRPSGAQRYRDAAELAVKQLDWCIDYLHRIRRPGLGQALRRNRNAIVKRHRL